jgi:hypothetical protein
MAVPEDGGGPGRKAVLTMFLIFDSGTATLNAEDALTETGIPFELVPIPKDINPNCGFGIEIDAGRLYETMQVLTEAKIHGADLLKIKGD